MSAAVGRSMQYVIPVMVLLFTVNLAAALSLYWLTGGIVAYFQQRAALKDEGEDLIEAADKPLTGERGSKITLNNIPEAELVESPKPKTKAAKTAKRKTAKKKRR